MIGRLDHLVLTTAHDAVQQYAASSIANTEASTGTELPRFIKDEFDAFLECGILAHGILMLRCGECGHDKLLAFSCKRRGFCPSCGARRMSQTAAYLVDHVIPHVPVRQPYAQPCCQRLSTLPARRRLPILLLEGKTPGLDNTT